MPPVPTSKEAELTVELAQHIDEHHGDYPLVLFEDDGKRVVAMYKNTELDILIDPDKPNGARRGKHPADLYATSFVEAILLISRVESLRQKRRRPMLRF